MFRKFSNKKDSGYEIGQSLLFDKDNDTWLSRTNTSEPTDGSKYTQSLWFKPSNLDNDGLLGCLTSSAVSIKDRLWFYRGAYGNPVGMISVEQGSDSSYMTNTDGGYRDPASFYHLHVMFDNSKSGEDKTVIHINGIRVAQNHPNGVKDVPATGYTANGASTYVGIYPPGGTPYPISGYIAEYHLIDGQYLGPEQFALTDSNGVYNPIRYTGTYGANGFYLPFEASDIGADKSGNDNDFTTSGLTSDSVVADSPSNNYCTLNPLDLTGSTYSNGNLTTTC